jgi:hypothetical protein
MMDLLQLGFQRFGTWAAVDGDLRLAEDKGFDAKPSGHWVYAFQLDRETVYIGATRMTLPRRLYGYRKPGPTQTTNIRLKALLLEEIGKGASIDVLGARPGHELWNGLDLDRAYGLESALITALRPRWNVQSKPKVA